MAYETLLVEKKGGIGKVETAEKGTLFLDEVVDLSPAAQVKVLRVLEEKEYFRVGSVEKKTAELLDMLREKGIETKGTPFLMRYNDPWTPPFLRRNEVAIEVE